MKPAFHMYERLDEIPLDAASWDRLVDAANIGGIFLSYAWVHAWWNTLSGDNKLRFITIEIDGELIGFAPMMLDRKRTLRFVADGNSDYLGFVIPPDRSDLLEQLMKFLVNRDDWSVMHLRNMPRSDCHTAAVLPACERSGMFPWNNYSVVAPYLAIEGNIPNVDALLNKYSLRRAVRKLAEQGALTFELVTDTDRAVKLLPQFADQHIKRCEIDNRKSPFINPLYTDFVRSLLNTPGLREIIHFSVVFLDERPIAFHLGFVSQRRLLWYKPSFDISISKGSPGIALIRNLIAYARDKGLSELDFTIGAEPFKDRFASGKRNIDTFRVHRSRLRFMLDVGYWRARHSAKKLLGVGRA